jgi:hypothetical protein
LVTPEFETVGDAVGVGDSVADALAVGEGVVFNIVPLFQTNFLPDLTQEYLTPSTVLVVPTLTHEVPAKERAFAFAELKVMDNVSNTRTEARNFITGIYLRKYKSAFLNLLLVDTNYFFL